MVIDERSRHELYDRLKQVLGEESAAVLMEHLPPVGWADVATKQDLINLRAEIRAEIRADLLSVRNDIALAMNNQTRTFVGWMLGAMSVVLVVATAALTAAL